MSIRDLVEQVTTTQNPSIFSAGSHRERLDSISFETYLREADLTPKAFATGQVWTHAMLGVDPSEVSALYFLECEFDPQNPGQPFYLPWLHVWLRVVQAV